MTRSRVWLPTLLAVTAAAANYVVLSRATATAELVAIRADKKAGTKLAESDFYPVAVRGDAALYRSAVSFAQRSMLYDMTLRRKLTAGELLLRADVESHDGQVEAPPPDHTTLTLPARPAVVATRPAPGEFVELYVRQPGASAGNAVAKYGPYRFLGWVAGPPSATTREQETVYVSVAVRTAGDARDAELRTVQETASPDRLIQVEVVRGKTVPK